MKNIKVIILLAVLALMGCTANAQSLFSSRVPWTPQPLSAATGQLVFKTTPDTLVNADTSYLYLYSTGINNRYDVVFHTIVTKVTGTLAGNVILQMSPDNATWYQAVGDTSQCISCVGVFGTVGNSATQTYDWIVKSAPMKYYRVREIQTGTSTSVPNGTGFYKW